MEVLTHAFLPVGLVLTALVIIYMARKISAQNTLFEVISTNNYSRVRAILATHDNFLTKKQIGNATMWLQANSHPLLVQTDKEKEHDGVRYTTY